MSTKVNSSFRPLQTISEERGTHGLRYGDYTRYRKHCARKTHRLRSALKMTHGKGREFKKLPQIAPENVKEGHLQLLLFETERAWAYAQELNADDDRRSTSRYRRSHWYLAQLLTLAQSPNLAISLTPQASVEFMVYGLIHTARFNLRRVPQSTAGYYGLKHEPVFGGNGNTVVPYPLIYLSIAYALLEELEKASQTSKEVAFARSFKDEIAPEIRWCVHEFESSPSYPEDEAEGRLVQLASKWKKREWDIEGIVKDIAPAYSREIVPAYEELVQKLRTKSAISDRKNVLEELVWEEKPIPLRNPEMVDVLLKVQDSLHKLKNGDGYDSKTKEGAGKATRGRLTKYDSVLLSLSDAVDQARKLVEAQQASGTNSATGGGRDIAFMHSVLTYLHLTYRIERDLILVSAISGQSDTPDGENGAISAQRTVSRLHLLSGILQSLTQALTLPIVDESADVSTGLSLRILHVRAERTLHLAQIYAHPTQRRYAEAVTLTQRGQLQVREAKTMLLGIHAPKGVSTHLRFYEINEGIIEEMEEKLAKFEEKCKREWFAYNGGAVGERKSEEDKPGKPVFFDIAFNYVEPPTEQLRKRAGLPALEGEMGTSVATKAKAETEEQQQQQSGAAVAPKDEEKKTKTPGGGGLAGFLGSWWGRK